VHVIGDACAAGAMPKAASSACAQALQCAQAIVAGLRGGAVAAAELDSVCYSFLARDLALAIHGRFATDAGAIRALPLPSTAQAPSAQQQARLAEGWYRRTVADSFGA
jgi:sulfide dehydrogenase [flavocytochrome c] flavoprotein subunit